MTQMLEFNAKDFKAAIIKILQVSARNRRYKETDRNFRSKVTVTKVKISAEERSRNYQSEQQRENSLENKQTRQIHNETERWGPIGL